MPTVTLNPTKVLARTGMGVVVMAVVVAAAIPLMLWVSQRWFAGQAHTAVALAAGVCLFTSAASLALYGCGQIAGLGSAAALGGNALRLLVCGAVGLAVSNPSLGMQIAGGGEMMLGFYLLTLVVETILLVWITAGAHVRQEMG